MAPAAQRKASDATGRFFVALEARGHVLELEKVSGTVRFDVVESARRVARWTVAISKGDLAVTRGDGSGADCTVRAERALLDGVVTGRVNALTALLRGAIQVEGDVALLVLFQRLFPAPRRRRKRP